MLDRQQILAVNEALKPLGSVIHKKEALEEDPPCIVLESQRSAELHRDLEEAKTRLKECIYKRS